MMNKVLLEGRPIWDPIYEVNEGGVAKATMILACNGYSTHGADFFRCIAWRKVADLIHQSVRKGTLISVEGQVRTFRYKDENSGKRSYSSFVKVDHVNYLEKKADRERRMESDDLDSYDLKEAEDQLFENMNTDTQE